MSRACDGDEMKKIKKYKSIDSYDYFKSGSIGKILQFAIRNRVVLKHKKVHLSQKINLRLSQ